MSKITLDEAMKFEKAQDTWLVEPEDNTPGIRFNGFKLRDTASGVVYYEYYPKDKFELDKFAKTLLPYAFPYQLLQDEKHLGTTLILCVGDKVVKDLVLLEIHYVEGKKFATFKFQFPIFMPNSENSVEFIYDIPKLSPEILAKMGKGENIEAKSDTYVFVEGKLVVHRRALYYYVKPQPAPEEKK